MKVSNALLCLECDELIDGLTIMECPSCTNKHLIRLASLVAPLHLELDELRQIHKAMKDLLS